MPNADAPESLTDFYRRAIRRCSTENQINQVHIGLENLLAPVEVRALAAALAADPDDAPGRRWAASLLASLPVNRPRPVEFRRIPILDGLTRYTAGCGRAADKTILVGFTGHALRMMLPTAVLLDCLNPAVYDVVLLRDAARVMYLRGIPGLGNSLFEVLENLDRHVDRRSYRHAIALGTSAGGLSALLAAVALDLEAGIAVGGQDFGRLAWAAKSIGVSDAPVGALLDKARTRAPRLVAVCGADYAHDLAAAESIAQRVPARVIRIPGCATHGILGHLLARNQLPGFLARVLGQSLEYAWPAVHSRKVECSPATGPAWALPIPRVLFAQGAAPAPSTREVAA